MKNISYIIPHYKSIESLERLIKSIEIIENDEIIVIDDCSGEYEFMQLKELQKKYSFILLFTNSNSGAGAARNIGLNKVKNEWILFADSDDYFIPGYRKLIHEYVERDVDIVYFKPTSVKEGENKSVQGDRHSYYVNLIDQYDLLGTQDTLNCLKYKMVVPWSKLISNNLIKKYNIKFDEVFLSNDVMFTMKFGLVAQNIETSEYCIYCCTENSESLTTDISFEKTMSRMKIFINQYNYLSSNLDYKSFKKLNFVGITFIYKSFKYNYSFSEKMKILNLLKENNIKIISLSWIINRFRR